MSTESANGQNGLTSKEDMKNMETIDDLDLTWAESDSWEERHCKTWQEKCLKLCQDYLSGNWNRQTMDTIEVRRVSGGLTNQLYSKSVAKDRLTRLLKTLKYLKESYDKQIQLHDEANRIGHICLDQLFKEIYAQV